MKPLSPVDAISPAFSRSRTLLCPPGPGPGVNAPFRMGFFLKIAIVAALSQPNIYVVVLGMAGEIAGVVVAVIAGVLGAAIHMHRGLESGSAGSFTGAAVAILAVVLFGIVAVSILLGWLWCRLRFTLFDLVVYRHGQVARAWSPYRSPTWRLFGLMMLIGLSLTLLVSITAGPLFLHLFLTLRHLTPQEINSDPTLVFSHIFPIYGVLLLVGLTAFAAEAVTQDFILPPMAIEDAPLASAFARFFGFLRDRFWSFLLYLLLRFALELGMGWVGMIGVFIILGVVGLAGGGAGFLLYHYFWHAGPAGMTLFIVYCVVAGLLFVALYLLLLFALYGVIAILKESFAVLYYGGHYPALGDRLEPPPAAAESPAWPQTPVPPPTSPPVPPGVPPAPELPPA